MYIHTHACTYTYMHIHIHTYTRELDGHYRIPFTDECTFTYAYTYTHTAYTHIHIHTTVLSHYTHTHHTHCCVPSKNRIGTMTLKNSTSKRCLVENFIGLSLRVASSCTAVAQMHA
jgi:hypothetical protein